MFTIKKKQPDESNQLMLGDDILRREAYTKFLGVYVDEHLKWNEHIHVNHFRAKLVSAFYAISKLESLIPIFALKTIYFSLAYPHLLYESLVWGGTDNIHIDAPRLLQKNIVRPMCNAPHNSHTDCMFKELGLFELDDIHKYEVGNLCIIFLI